MRIFLCDSRYPITAQHESAIAVSANATLRTIRECMPQEWASVACAKKDKKKGTYAGRDARHCQRKMRKLDAKTVRGAVKNMTHTLANSPKLGQEPLDVTKMPTKQNETQEVTASRTPSMKRIPCRARRSTLGCFMHRLATRFEHYSPRGADASLDLNNFGRQF